MWPRRTHGGTWPAWRSVRTSPSGNFRWPPPGRQFSLGKSYPGFGPVGPWLVTPDEFDDPDDLELGCSINGEQVQLGRTGELIFGVSELIEELSRVTLLLPGDLIFTGTPSGVGVGRTPPRWLGPGDVLTSFIQGIGEMRHRFVAAGPRGRDANSDAEEVAMSLHGLLSVTIGVPNVEETAAYYTDFGLAPAAGSWFSTVDGGPQLRIVPAPTRRLVELRVAADDMNDLGRAATNLASYVGLRRTALRREPCHDRAGDRHPGIPRRRPPRAPGSADGDRLQRTWALRPYGQPGPGFMRPDRVRPRKSGHAVLGSVDYRATMAFFVDGLGFKISDWIKDMGAFMRCSTDHHNMLVLSAPVNFLHHTAWQVDDIDEVGRGAYAMLEGHPERHVWGLGRHYAGSNFFWYSRIRPAISASTTRTSTASSDSCGAEDGRRAAGGHTRGRDALMTSSHASTSTNSPRNKAGP